MILSVLRQQWIKRASSSMQLFVRTVRASAAFGATFRPLALSPTSHRFDSQDAGRTLVVAATPATSAAELLALVVTKQQQAQNPQDDDADRSAANDRYLHYGGVPLRPQCALSEYGIQNHATLALATRLRGGCFSVSILLWIVIFVCCLLSICTCGLSLGVAACLLPFALLLPLCCL